MKTTNYTSYVVRSGDEFYIVSPDESKGIG